MQKMQVYNFILAVIFVSTIRSTISQHIPPYRSIQLGGTGGRPVTLGSEPPSPFATQPHPQLNFGPGPQLQAQHLQPTYVQRQGVNLPPLGPLPNQRSPHQQILQRAPQISAAPISPRAPSTADEEEYEDEYEDGPPQSPIQIRPVGDVQQAFRGTPAPIRAPTPIPQRSPVRIPQQIPVSPAPQQPQRFLIQQPQPQQQVLRTIPATPANRPIAQAPPQPIRGQLGQDSRLLIGGDRQGSTAAPIKTIDRYMKTNEDGSTSWGYTNEDGTFKEETIGADCVVRGKYGYVDPDGVKREYEYQSGNPCDPNKRGQPEEDEEEVEAVGQQRQRLGGILNARPVQYQGQPLQQQRQ